MLQEKMMLDYVSIIQESIKDNHLNCPRKNSNNEENVECIIYICVSLPRLTIVTITIE